MFVFKNSTSCTLRCYILRHRQLGGECQIAAVYMTHTWCNWLDTRPTSVTTATPPLTSNCYANAQPDASVVHVFWRLAQDASVAGWPRPRSCTKGALFKPEPAALKAAATEEAVTQRNTHYTRIPQNKKGCEMLTPLCFPHSGRSVWMGQLLRSHLGSIHFSIVSCSFKLTGGKLSWNVWLIIASSNIRAKSLSVVKRHSNSCWGSHLQFAVVFSTCCGSSVYHVCWEENGKYSFISTFFFFII